MSTATTKKKLILNTVAVSLGCSSGCKRPKLSFIFHPKPKSKKQNYQKHPPRTSLYNNSTAISLSPNTDTTTPMTTQYWDTAPDVEKTRQVRGFGRVGCESVAVEKESDDPYLDFRQSMLQMIMEKEIYSKDDLKELLNCFLQLNSPYHHKIIVRAFTEIWNGVYSVNSAPGSSSKLHYFGHGFGFK